MTDGFIIKTRHTMDVTYMIRSVTSIYNQLIFHFSRKKYADYDESVINL